MSEELKTMEVIDKLGIILPQITFIANGLIWDIGPDDGEEEETQFGAHFALLRLHDELRELRDKAIASIQPDNLEVRMRLYGYRPSQAPDA